MLLWVWVLIPVVLADLQEKTINNYVVKIDGHTLKSVEPTRTSSRVLNLSGLGLRVLEKDVFNNLTMVKNLDLGNNSLSSIPTGLFSKLGNLKHLSLANNNIRCFEKTFEGLSHLKTLNISNNPLTSLRSTYLYGLTKSSVVFTKGLTLWSLDACVFEKDRGPYLMDLTYSYEDVEETTISYNQNPTIKTPEKELNSNKTDIKNKQKGNSVKLEDRRRRNIKNLDDTSKTYNIKICIDNDVLKLVGLLEKNETLPSGCRRGNAERDEYTYWLDLNGFGIANFEKGWYQLDNKPINMLNLRNNKIVIVTRELLNDLPASVSRVDLSNNDIERLNSGIINNSYVRELRLSSNRISKIEANALANMPQLRDLYLNQNLLNDTKFASSLPSSLFEIHLQENRITEISPGSFFGLTGLVYLYLNRNLIQEVKSNSLHGLVNINLSNNRISNIEPAAFQRTNLRIVNLVNNSISNFRKGTFDNLRISKLDVSYNKLLSINETFPNSDRFELILDYNEIKELEHDNFKNVRVERLSLTGNKISKIKRGAFDSRTLISLVLDKNLLNELDIDSFHGLKHIQRLLLSENGITSIPKGFTKNMRHLAVLHLSKNPIKVLQNGALYGFRRSGHNFVSLEGVPLEVIEGGLFDDM